jgi:hypothetical protein
MLSRGQRAPPHPGAHARGRQWDGGSRGIVNRTDPRVEQISLTAYGQAEETRAMANEEHLAQLLQAIAAWNQWREDR